MMKYLKHTKNSVFYPQLARLRNGICYPINSAFTTADFQFWLLVLSPQKPGGALSTRPGRVTPPLNRSPGVPGAPGAPGSRHRAVPAAGGEHKGSPSSRDVWYPHNGKRTQRHGSPSPSYWKWDYKF